MFDSPKKISMQKNFGIMNFDKNLLENATVGKKPNTLPPLLNNNADKSYNTTLKQHNKLAKSVSKPSHRQHLTQIASPRDTLDSMYNSHVDTLIKETAKQRLNDFDALCAQLVQQTEDGRKQRKQSSRPDTPSHYKPSQPVNRRNTFRVNEDDKDVFETEEELSHTQQEQQRPKTSTLNRAERPKTGYGSRRRRPNYQET